MSSSCLIPADSVGWLTLQASAALPKCCSRARAITNSSLSIMSSTQDAPSSTYQGTSHRTATTWRSQTWRSPTWRSQ